MGIETERAWAKKKIEFDTGCTWAEKKIEFKTGRICAERKIEYETRHTCAEKKKEYETGRTWIEVNIKNLQHNVETLQKAMQPSCELMAVVKAEAYGHGLDIIAANLNQMGVRAFAVATIDEGIKLRESGIRGEILILGYTDVCRAYELKKYDLTQTLISFEYAQSVNNQGMAVKAHMKIDTGMHRLGLSSEKIAEAVRVFSMKNLIVCGIFTHLCCSDSRQPDDVAFTRGQIDRFYNLLAALKNNGVRIPKVHIQSSYGLLNYPELTCDYVRAGIALYGVLSSPNDDTVLKLDLRPVFSLKSRVAMIREVKKGDSIGYSRSFTARHRMRIAILPVGYGDGFPRNLSNGNGGAWIHQHMEPIVGRICMDQLAVDVTDVENVSVGDVATLVGAEGCRELSAPAVAENSGSISNELLCRMGSRLPIVAV